MSISVKNFLYSVLVQTLALTLAPTTVQASELTGRFSILGTTARSAQGDNTLTADQQSLRLMLDNSRMSDNSRALDESLDNGEWSIHMKTARVHLSDFPFSDTHSSDLFRYEKLSSYWLDENDGNNSTHLGYKIDRAFYKQRFQNTTLAIGRQSIDWGSGRFWQPLNVFGSFAPTDLDTDHKPGIDALRLDWFPSELSSLSAVYAFSPKDNVTVDNSAAIHYRRQAGDQAELALLAANVIANKIIGASYESAWGGMGWSIEAAHYQEKNNNDFTFWIAGLNYQFKNGTLVNAEWYHNSRAANNISALTSTNVLTDPFIKYGLQQHLSQDVLGISLNKDLSPLWNGSYTLLASPLKDSDEKLHTSLLHQLNLIYSVSNESDLLISFQSASGRGTTTLGQVQSEFGHNPTSLTLRLRFYF